MEKLNVYDIVFDIPRGSKVLPCHIILKRKRDALGNPTKYKARLVGGGHRQDASMFDETSSPTARMTSVKILLQLAASRHYFYSSVDVTAAFLHAKIDKEIYISIPDIDNPGSRKYARLRKSLYGLKQAGKLWFDDLNATLKDFGAVPTQHDQCVFTYHNSKGAIMYLAIHVDDLLIVASEEHLIDELHEHLKKRYGSVTRADASTHLGIAIERDVDGNIMMSQPGLLKKLIDELELDPDNYKTSEVPISEQYATGKDRRTDKPVDQTAFQRLVGILIYLCHSRPDLLFASSILSSHSSSPCHSDLRAAFKVGRYLLSTQDLKLVFRSHSEIKLHGYADASFASHPDGRSQSGNTVHLVEGSAPVAAFSKKQNLVALSSTEAELESLKSETTLIQWVLGLMQELGYEPDGPVEVREDNMAAISLINNPGTGNWGRTRHYCVRYNFIKSKVEEHTISLTYINTSEQLADIFTKALPAPQFTYLRDILLGVSPS
jgi:hypothetical protein